MSSRFRVYAGPYLRCETERVNDPIDTYTCTSEICHTINKPEKLPPYIKACPHCQSPVDVVKVPGLQRDKVSAPELFFKTEEALALFNGEYSKPGVHTYIPNHDWPRSFVYDKDGGETGELLSPDTAMIAEEIKWLEDTYAEQIKAARELYGENNIHIKWGLIAEFH